MRWLIVMLALPKRIGQRYICNEVTNAEITWNLEQLTQLSWLHHNAMRPMHREENWNWATWKSIRHKTILVAWRMPAWRQTFPRAAAGAHGDIPAASQLQSFYSRQATKLRSLMGSSKSRCNGWVLQDGCPTYWNSLWKRWHIEVENLQCITALQIHGDCAIEEKLLMKSKKYRSYPSHGIWEALFWRLNS